MTMVNSKQFVTNQKRYFDMAVKEDVVIKRGKNLFHLTCTTGEHNNIGKRVFYEPDEDFYSSISKDELLKGIYEDIDNFFANV
jgi:hypothetical protein